MAENICERCKALWSGNSSLVSCAPAGTWPPCHTSGAILERQKWLVPAKSRACSGGRQCYSTKLCSSATWSHQGLLQPGAPKTPSRRGDSCKQLREPSRAAEQHLADQPHFSSLPLLFPYSMTMTAQGKSSQCDRKDNWKIKSFLSPSPSHISCT